MELTMIQILLLTVLSFVSIIDGISFGIGTQFPMISGAISGLIVGDIKLGLLIGATLQLMVLGVGTYGGASIPDFTTGAIIGTAFAYTSNQGTEFAIALAVPVGLLMVQLDILARFTNTYFLHRVDGAIENLNYKSISTNVLLGIIPWGLSRAIPVLIMLLFGQNVVNIIINKFPDWLMGGLKVAGGLLPVVGIAVLLRYLPIKRFIPFLMVGFFFTAFLDVSMLGVSILGLAMALIYFKTQIKEVQSDRIHEQSSNNYKGDYYEGEYEE
ncbi:PTS mannose/fructose/sorbose/N-acetylgalactosamine transporter subunit IIC [Helcococcus kunzii]|uniref:PTS mannose/fructose/sorbose/N-acetylgalactosamine transporter subunit IIC n=1 Tax=Helcococcus kunzii TaxID=40091 RepID=UPI0038A9C70A